MEQIKLPTGEKLYQTKLANGLAVFVLPKAQFIRTYAVLSTNYGAIDSQFKLDDQEPLEMPRGIAHFLEHKLFEQEEGNVFQNFARWGASVNAFTSYTQTSYLFATTQNWQQALIQLIQFVNDPYFTEENVEKEKGIIAQELRMYEDYPSHRIHSLLLENLYHNNPVRWDIGGTVESVNSITVEQLLTCYMAFYQPGNLALAVVGDVEPWQTLDLIKKNYPSWSASNGVAKRVYPEEPFQIVRDWVEQQMNLSRPRYLLGFKHEPVFEGEALLRQQIVMSLVWRLIAGRGSEHFMQLYEKNLVNDSFGASFNATSQFSYSVIGSETDEPERLHDELTGIIKKIQGRRLALTDLERLKRQYHGRHLASYDSFEYVGNRLISHYFSGTSYHQYLELIHSIGVEEIEAAFRECLDWKRSSVTVLRPV